MSPFFILILGYFCFAAETHWYKHHLYGRAGWWVEMGVTNQQTHTFHDWATEHVVLAPVQMPACTWFPRAQQASERMKGRGSRSDGAHMCVCVCCDTGGAFFFPDDRTHCFSVWSLLSELVDTHSYPAAKNSVNACGVCTRTLTLTHTHKVTASSVTPMNTFPNYPICKETAWSHGCIIHACSYWGPSLEQVCMMCSFGVTDDSPHGGLGLDPPVMERQLRSEKRRSSLTLALVLSHAEGLSCPIPRPAALHSHQEPSGVKISSIIRLKQEPPSHQKQPNTGVIKFFS